MRQLHNFFLWFSLWTKRLLLRPFFLLTLLLLPSVTLFIEKSRISNDAILRIALYTDDTSSDAVSENLKKELLELSNSTVTFYYVSSKTQVYTDVARKKAVSGYILPGDLENSLKKYAKDRKPFITAVQNNAEMSNQIVNEILLSKLYQTHAFHILVDFISEKDTRKNLPFLQERFESYKKHELLFRFEYADGSENKLLNRSTGLLLMPLRGIIAVLLFLASLTGAFTWYADKKSGFTQNIPTKKRKLCILFSLFVPAIYAECFGILSIEMTEISESFFKESICMSCFLFACAALIYFLLNLIRQKEIFLSCIPFFTIGSLLLCPVFIDVSHYIPVLGYLRYLLPVHYYLRSLHSITDLFSLLLYGCFFLLFGKLLFKYTYRFL